MDMYSMIEVNHVQHTSLKEHKKKKRKRPKWATNENDCCTVIIIMHKIIKPRFLGIEGRALLETDRRISTSTQKITSILSSDLQLLMSGN